MGEARIREMLRTSGKVDVRFDYIPKRVSKMLILKYADGRLEIASGITESTLHKLPPTVDEVFVVNKTLVRQTTFVRKKTGDEKEEVTAPVNTRTRAKKSAGV